MVISVCLCLFLLYIFIYKNKNKPLLYATLVFIAVFIYNFLDVEYFGIKGIARINDFVLFYLFYLSYVRSKYRYGYLNKKSKRIVIIILILFVSSAIVSLIIQEFIEMIKIYRFCLWFFLPFFLVRLIKYDEVDKFVNYLFLYIVFLNICFLLESTGFPGRYLPYAPRIIGGLAFRSYSDAIVYNGFFGAWALIMFYKNNKFKYLFFLGIISLATLACMGRSFTAGYLLSLAVTMLLINRYLKNIFKFAATYVFVVFIAGIMVILLSSKFDDALSKRFVEETNAQFEEKEQSNFLSSRWPRFQRRMEWLMQQHISIKMFGPGIMNMETDTKFDSYDDNLTYKYQIAESSWMNTILTNGIVGSIIIFTLEFSIIFIGFRHFHQKICDFPEFSSGVSYMFFLAVSMISSVGIEYYQITIIFGLIVYLFNSKQMRIVKTVNLTQ